MRVGTCYLGWKMRQLKMEKERAERREQQAIKVVTDITLAAIVIGLASLATFIGTL